MTVFLVFQEYFSPTEQGSECLGVYSTRELAEAVVKNNFGSDEYIRMSEGAWKRIVDGELTVFFSIAETMVDASV